MATRNVELVKRWYRGLGRGEPLPELRHPEIVIRNWDEAPVRGPFGSIVTIRDDLIVSARGYASPGRAKKAAGMRRDEDPAG